MLSINQKTLDGCPLDRLLPLLAERGIDWVGLWLEPVEEHGVAATARLLAEHGVGVSSLCRATALTAGPASRERNRRAVEVTAQLGASCLAVVVGGLPPGSVDLPAARATARTELAWLASLAAEHGVRLALEPMHPVFAADRGVLTTLGEARQWIAPYDAATVGIALDAFHVWWDPDLEPAWEAVADRVLGVQVGDWATPVEVRETVQRALPGDGHLDLAGFLATARRLGWSGPVEVELFNEALAARAAVDPAAVLDEVVGRWEALAQAAGSSTTAG